VYDQRSFRDEESARAAAEKALGLVLGVDDEGAPVFADDETGFDDDKAEDALADGELGEESDDEDDHDDHDDHDHHRGA
jgi:hypothetical protein